MKKTSILLLIAAFWSSAMIIQSCEKDDDDNEPENEPSEFVADNSTFADFMNWSLDATAQGADPALGGAHGGNDSSVTRNVYFMDGQDPNSNGEYPKGTVIVKHSNNPSATVDEYTAMVKRGESFNSDGGGWEYFMLESNGNIAEDGDGNPMRGAQLMNGMCANCHASASSSDYVFSK